MKSVDLAVGGDSGGGFFWMMLKVLFRFNDNKTISHIFQIASMSYSKDDIAVFKRTVLDKIGNSLKLIVDGGHFTFHLSQDIGRLSVNYEHDGDEAICSIPMRLFKVGDLKYYMQMLERDGISSSWCVWCMSHPSYWRSYFTVPKSIPQEEKEPWMIEAIIHHKKKMIANLLKKHERGKAL